MLEQQLVNALSLGCVYALFALGFTLIFGVLDVINLSHGAVFMVGAYAALYAISRLGAPLWLGMLIAFAVAGLVAAVIDRLVLRPLRHRGAPQLIAMIATIGIGIILTNGAQGIFGPNNQRFPHGTVPEATFELAGVHMTAVGLGIIFLSVVLMALLMVLMRRTRFGRALRAVAESPKAAWLLGVDVERLFLTTSFAAGGLGGIAGVLIGLYSDALYPLMGEPMLQKGIAVVILGGLGSIPGAMLGGLFLGFSEVLSVAYVGSTMRDAVAFGLLFLVLLLRPQGLFGKAAQRKA
jgi:branched-chain amino acid transport system permease protein